MKVMFKIGLFFFVWVGISEEGVKLIYVMKLGDFIMFCFFFVNINSDELVVFF